MHHSIRRLANSITSQPLNATLREAKGQLHPPIPLYRRLLRAHRGLPPEMRSIGDDYVKSEFRRHRDVVNPLHIIGFLKEWKIYLEALSTSKDGGVFRGRKLDPMVFDKMSDEQIIQLHELMNVTQDIWKPVESDEGQASHNGKSR